MVGSCGVGGTREVGVWVSRNFLSSFIIIIILFFFVLDVTLYISCMSNVSSYDQPPRGFSYIAWSGIKRKIKP